MLKVWQKRPPRMHTFSSENVNISSVRNLPALSLFHTFTPSKLRTGVLKLEPKIVRYSRVREKEVIPDPLKKQKLFLSEDYKP